MVLVRIIAFSRSSNFLVINYGFDTFIFVFTFLVDDEGSYISPGFTR